MKQKNLIDKNMRTEEVMITLQMTYSLWQQTRDYFIGDFRVKEINNLYNAVLKKLDEYFSKEETRDNKVLFELPLFAVRTLLSDHPECEYKSETITELTNKQ